MNNLKSSSRKYQTPVQKQREREREQWLVVVIHARAQDVDIMQHLVSTIRKYTRRKKQGHRSGPGRETSKQNEHRTMGAGRQGSGTNLYPGNTTIEEIRAEQTDDRII